MKMRYILAIAASALLASPLAAATPVAANQNGTTSLGFFAAGTYNITASGTIDLIGSGGTMTLKPDGVPLTAVTAPAYLYFNPNGSFQADGVFGPGGSGIKIGALMGSLVAAPAGPSDFFSIGFGTTVTLAAPGQIFAQVNDTFYPNNVGAFSVNVQAAIPEPGSWALMIAGFGIAGAAARRRRAVPSFA